MRNTISLKVKCNKAPGIIHISCSQWLLKQFDPLPSSSRRWSKKHESLTAMYSSFIQFLSKRRNNLKPTRISDAFITHNHKKNHPKPNQNKTTSCLSCRGWWSKVSDSPTPLQTPLCFGRAGLEPARSLASTRTEPVRLSTGSSPVGSANWLPAARQRLSSA